MLDLTRLLPGAFATLMLAELGADVVKIEDPRGGDPMRRLPPTLNGRGLYDLLLNRGKRSVALDLQASEALPHLDRLLARADVIIESFRPATARRLGVDGETIRARHRRVIHCAITGYGQTGPYADRPGHDLNYVAESGLLATDRPDPGELPRMFIADVGGGAMSAVIGILAALLARERGGPGAPGRTLDISMHEASLYWVMLPAARHLIDAGEQAVGELPTFGRHACYNVYRTRDDRRIALGALEPKFWRTFCEAVGRADLIDAQDAAGADQDALVATVARVFAERTRDEWVAFFQGRDVCLSPVNSAAEALTDPHVAARGTVAHASGLRTIRPPFLEQAPNLAPAPRLGEHTEEVLAEAAEAC